MTRVLVAALLLLLGAGFQASQLNHLLPVQVDPLLMLVVAWSLALGSRAGATFGLAAAALQDAIVGGGLTLLPRVLLGAGFGRLKPLLFYRQAPVVLPLMILATCLHEGAVALQLVVTGHPQALYRLGTLLLPEALGNLVIGWPLYLLVRWTLSVVPEDYRARAEGLEA